MMDAPKSYYYYMEARSPWAFAVQNYIVTKQVYDLAIDLRVELSDATKWQLACLGANLAAALDNRIHEEMLKPPKPFIAADGTKYEYVGPWPPKRSRNDE